MIEKRILDVTTKGWKPESVDKLRKEVYSKYKYQVRIRMADGQVKFAYCNEEPELMREYLKSQGAVMLGFNEL